MKPFAGFQFAKDELIDIPSQFFSDLLPLIDDLAELKITLYCFWAMQRQEGQIRYVRFGEALDDAVLYAAMGDKDTLRQAFQHAVLRGTLLSIDVTLQGQADTLYVFNSLRGRQAVQAFAEGRWYPDPLKRPVQIVTERPNIYALYEQNIGHITPMVADRLRDAEDEFPHEWIVEAIGLAVENNARKWSYVIAILDRWKTDGRKQRHDEASQRSDSQFGNKKGDFSDFFNT